MSTKLPESVISETNLSYAWGRAFLLTMGRSDRDLTPLVISIAGFVNNAPVEDLCIREALDGSLARYEKYSCTVSALTIFPYKHWKRAGYPPGQQLFGWYLDKFLPRLKARDRENQYGTYFQRMIAFQGTRLKNGKNIIETKNQLGHIIQIWRGGSKTGRRPRQSALQVTCFDPVKDHTGQAVRGFPCLQQVSFTYDNGGGLAVNAYYPTQYMFDRAYGNYLGLCHLGHFMAHELGLGLVRFNCFIGRPELGDISKKNLRALEKTVRKILLDK